MKYSSPDNVLKGLNPSKAAGIDNLSDKFLKDGTDILARPISQLCNLLSNSTHSLELVKLQKSNCFLRKAPKLTLKTTTPFQYSSSDQELWKGLFMTKHKSF